jgi:hypothetical protein
MSFLRLTPVKSTGRSPLLQRQSGCRTTHGKNLCPLGSSPAGFSTPRTLLFFSRRRNPPSRVLCGRTAVVPRCICLRWRGTRLCLLQSLSPCSPYYNDLIPAISPAPQRAIYVSTALPSMHVKARDVHPLLPLDAPWHRPCIKQEWGHSYTISLM